MVFAHCLTSLQDILKLQESSQASLKAKFSFWTIFSKESFSN